MCSGEWKVEDWRVGQGCLMRMRRDFHGKG